MESHEVAEPVEASSKNGGGHTSVLVLVQFDVGDILGLVYTQHFPEMSFWELLTVFPSFDVMVHSSLLQKTTRATYALVVLILKVLLIYLLSNRFFSLLKASIAIICLRLVCFSGSSKLPSNLHFFHFSVPCRSTPYRVARKLPYTTK